MSMFGDRYETIRELGRGSMGQVLLARQLNLGRLVVIKQPLAEHLLEVPRLLAEARLAAKLSHPAIVGVLDVSAVPPYIAMEYVAGLTLRELIAGAPHGLPPAVALTITLDVLRGLDYAHGEGVIHRDIKPRNIMVTFGGYSKLIDFGISRWLSQAGSWDSTSAAGTPGYMSPEQQGGARLDARVDQFAVAVTLREMLVGHDSNASSAHTIELAPGLSAIIDRGTAHRAEDRYPSCAELAEALEEYAESEGIAPSHAVVERWIRDHHAPAIDEWRRESSGKIDTEMVTNLHRRSSDKQTEQMTPSERAALGTGSSAGSRPTSPNQAESSAATRPRVTRRHWALIALVCAAGIAGLAIALTRSGDPPQQIVVDLVAKNLGEVDDAWLVPAIEQMTRRGLRNAGGRRFLLARMNVQPTTIVEIGYRVTARGVMLEAKQQGRGAPLARAEGASVDSATSALVTKLVAELGKDRAIAGPDAEEAAQMAKLGARTYDQYRRLQALIEQVRMSGYLDPTRVGEELEALQREDPTWTRVYGELAWARTSGRRTTLDTLTEGRSRGDRARDPTGMKLLEAQEAVEQLRHADAERLVAPLFAENDADICAGDVLYIALSGQDKRDAARAVARRMYERFPAGMFAGEMVADLDREGRRDQAATLAHSILADHPHNISVLRELVRIEADRGNLDVARRWAKRMLLLYAESSLAATELFEALIAVDDLAAAQRVVDGMLLGPPLTRARGYYRAAVVAVHEARFEIAQVALNEAIKLFPSFGDQSELPQSFALARAIAQLRGDSAAAAEVSQKLATWYDELGDSAGASCYRYREHIERTGTCEPIETALGTLEEPDRTTARRDMVRAGADVGCATCDAVLAAGLRNGETTSEALITYGLCARKAGDLALAKRTLGIAAAWSSWASSSDSTPVHAILAQYHLAGVLAELGDKAGARARYERFLRNWGEMTNPIPEIAKARAALVAL